MPCAFDGLNKHPLVTRTGARDPLRNDTALLRDKPLKFLLVLVIDVDIFVFAEPADAFLSHLCAASVFAWLESSASL